MILSVPDEGYYRNASCSILSVPDEGYYRNASCAIIYNFIDHTALPVIVSIRCMSYVINDILYSTEKFEDI